VSKRDAIYPFLYQMGLFYEGTGIVMRRALRICLKESVPEDLKDIERTLKELATAAKEISKRDKTREAPAMTVFVSRTLRLIRHELHRIVRDVLPERHLNKMSGLIEKIAD